MKPHHTVRPHPASTGGQGKVAGPTKIGGKGGGAGGVKIGGKGGGAGGVKIRGKGGGAGGVNGNSGGVGTSNGVQTGGQIENKVDTRAVMMAFMVGLLLGSVGLLGVYLVWRYHRRRPACTLHMHIAYAHFISRASVDDRADIVL